LIRLPDSTAAVPTNLATVTRSRAGATYTPVVNSRVLVTAAMAEMAHQESGQSLSGAHTGDPSS
jgi:hypothetical protein